MYRYVALIWDARSSEVHRTQHLLRASVLAPASKWSIAYEGPGALVVHSSSRQSTRGCRTLHSHSGIVLGTLFRRRGQNDDNSDAPFDEEETQRIVTTGAQHLVDHYWGSYVAIIHDRHAGKHYVLREPTCNLPCYYTRQQGIDCFFADVEDYLEFLPTNFCVDRNYLSRWLIVGRLPGRRCGLEDVEDLPGGERITVCRGTITRATLWDPIAIARQPRFESPDEASTLLRSCVQATIDAWAVRYRRIALKLSGGLDSSIVAGCLAQTPSRPQLTFLNFSTDVGFDQERLYLPGVDPRTANTLRKTVGPGDERHYARLVANRWSTILIERQRALSMDLRRMWDAPLTVTPSGYFTAMEVDDLEIEMANANGIEAFFSGQAGDSLFLATIQPLPAIDYAYLKGLTPDSWHHLIATCMLSKESLWSVLFKVIKHGYLKLPYRSPISILDQPTLVRKEIIETLGDDSFTDFTSDVLASLPPGKQNHVKGIAGSAFYDSVFQSAKYADHIDPLNSQPIWELMLSIPTYTILSGGTSRGLARHAFSDLLPNEIRRRQVKGSGAPFYQQLVRRNRHYLREYLLDGLLVREKYLDGVALEKCLGAEEPFLAAGGLDLLAYLAAEIWVQQWQTPRQHQRDTRVEHRSKAVPSAATYSRL